mgnify:CR=1 FL=1
MTAKFEGKNSNTLVIVRFIVIVNLMSILASIFMGYHPNLILEWIAWIVLIPILFLTVFFSSEVRLRGKIKFGLPIFLVGLSSHAIILAIRSVDFLSGIDLGASIVYLVAYSLVWWKILRKRDSNHSLLF